MGPKDRYDLRMILQPTVGAKFEIKGISFALPTETTHARRYALYGPDRSVACDLALLTLFPRDCRHKRIASITAMP